MYLLNPELSLSAGVYLPCPMAELCCKSFWEKNESEVFIQMCKDRIFFSNWSLVSERGVWFLIPSLPPEPCCRNWKEWNDPVCSSVCFCLKVQLCFVPTRYKSKPSDDYENPKDVEEIREARENMGYYNLKTASNYREPEHKRMTTEKRVMQLASLEELVCKLIYRCVYFCTFGRERIAC